MWNGARLFFAGLGVQLLAVLSIAVLEPTLEGAILMTAPGVWMSLIGAGAWAVEIGTRHLRNAGRGIDAPAVRSAAPPSRPAPEEDKPVAEVVKSAVQALLHESPPLRRDEVVEGTGFSADEIDRALHALIGQGEVAHDGERFQLTRRVPWPNR